MDTPSLLDEISILHAELCSALADSHRILILYLLANQPCTVSNLALEIGISQPTASRHLKILRDAGLVHSSRLGQFIEYRLSDNRLIEALDLLRGVLHDRITYRASLVENGQVSS